MQLRSSHRRGALAALGLTLVVVAAACAPMTPPGTTTTTTSTTSTTTTSSTTTTTVGPQDPVAVAAATPTGPGFFGLPVSFSSAGSNDPDGGSIVSYQWDFGAGPGSTAANPTFTYRQPGTYAVTLTVTDDEGATGSTTINVNQPAPVGDVVLSSNPIAVAANPGSSTVKAWWNNQTPGQLVYVDICRRPSTAIGFDPGIDCSSLSSQTPNGTASGSGVIDVDIFRGPTPDGDSDWGCFAASDPTIPGIQKFTTCYVRVTNQSLYNNTAAKEVAFTITG